MRRPSLHQANAPVVLFLVSGGSIHYPKAMLRLRQFFFTAILPELAAPRIQNGGIREPSEWLESLNRKIELF